MMAEEKERFQFKKNKKDVKLVGGKKAVYEMVHEVFEEKLIEAKYKSIKNKK